MEASGNTCALEKIRTKYGVTMLDARSILKAEAVRTKKLSGICSALEVSGNFDIVELIAPEYGVGGSKIEVYVPLCAKVWTSTLARVRVLDVDTGEVLTQLTYPLPVAVCGIPCTTDMGCLPDSCINGFCATKLYGLVFTMPNKNLNIRAEVSGRSDFSVIEDVKTATILLGGEANIVISNVKVSPSPAEPGERLRIDARVENKGTASGEKVLVCTIDGKEVRRESTGIMLPGAVLEGGWFWFDAPVDAGVYNICVD